MPFSLFNIFKNRNKVSPAPSPDSTPVGSISIAIVKPETDSRSNSFSEHTPRQRESHGNSIDLPELKRNNFTDTDLLSERSSSEKVKSFIIIPENQSPLSGEEFRKAMEKEGVPLKNFYDFEREAFYAGRKAYPEQSFSVHEIEYFQENMQVIDINKNELGLLHAESSWKSGKSFKPEDDFASGVENNLKHTSYYILPVSFAEIENIEAYSSKKKTLDALPPLFNTAEEAFKNGRKNFPDNPLSIIQLDTPMKSLGDLKAKYRDPLVYLIANSTAIIEYSAKDKKFNEGKKVWEIKRHAPESNDFPTAKKNK